MGKTLLPLPNVSLKIEHMSDDLQKRLQRLGVVRGTRNLKSLSTPGQSTGRKDQTDSDESRDSLGNGSEEQRLGKLIPNGQLLFNELGACFVVDQVYPAEYQHGDGSVADFINAPIESAADITGDERLRDLGYRDFVLLDTETTGLRGAGTLVFMVGLAFFENDALVVRQYFMRDHADEPAMLQALAGLLNSRQGIITFNGRSFDLPLLDNRYFLNRMDDQVADLVHRPHLDLLHPSRRLWRRRLGSCALASLEKNLLGISRTQEDVPGWMIPGIYMDYLRSGDARDIARVFYHNHLDMLSMVTLSSRVLSLFSTPTEEDHPLDLLSLARWNIASKDLQNAEETLMLALNARKNHNILREDGLAMRLDLGYLLRRTDRREEAIQQWQRIAKVDAVGPEGPFVVNAYIELAKHFEWRQRDINTARQWTIKAHYLVEQMDPGFAREKEAINHRLARLDRKLGSGQDEQLE